jgi:hypothetical protein
VVAHPDRVRIGKADGQLSANAAVIFHHDVSFAPDVLCRSLNVRPNAGFKQLATRLIDHAEESVLGCGCGERLMECLKCRRYTATKARETEKDKVKQTRE